MCSSDSPATRNFTASIGPHQVFCSLEKPVVLKMLKAFFENNSWLSTIDKDGICQALAKRFPGIMIHDECPADIQFDQV